MLLFGYLDLFLLSEEKQQEIIEKTRLIFREAVELFEYIKNNKEYWNELKLDKPVVIKALPIA